MNKKHIIQFPSTRAYVSRGMGRLRTLFTDLALNRHSIFVFSPSYIKLKIIAEPISCFWA